MTDHRKEWAEGLLRDATPGRWVFDGTGSNDLFAAEDIEDTDNYLGVLTREDKVTAADACLIAAAPDLAAAVISLAGEVERLTRVLEGIATYDGRAGLGYEAPASFAAAALSPHPSERKGP